MRIKTSWEHAMQELIEIISSFINSPWFLAVLLATTIPALYQLLNLTFEEKSKSVSKAKAKLFSLFDKSRLREDLFNLDYVRITKASIEREFSINLSTGDILQDYFVHVQDQKADAKSYDDIEKFHIKICSLIKTENEEQPFESLPEDERRLLRSLSDAIRHDDKESIRFNLDELCSVVSVRHKEYQKAHRISRWAVPLAVFGLLFTLIFGVTSIIGTVNKKDIEEAVRCVIVEQAKETKTQAVKEPTPIALR